MSTKPWMTGPSELIGHAIDHIRTGRAFDYRIAMISVDNAVELGIKTFLGLPKRVRGSDGPGRKELENASHSFPDLLDLLERYAGDRLSEIELGDIEVYHRLRNTLYHDGNGVTVDQEHVDGYLQVARILLKNLLDIEVAEDDESKVAPTTRLGDFIEAWNTLETRLRFYITNVAPELERRSLSAGVHRLAENGVIRPNFMTKFEPVLAQRNAIVHGTVTLSSRELTEIIAEVQQLISEVPGAGC